MRLLLIYGIKFMRGKLIQMTAKMSEFWGVCGIRDSDDNHESCEKNDFSDLNFKF